MSSPPVDAVRLEDQQLLRRVDWRFLAGSSRFERGVLDAGTEMTAAASAICDEVVDLGSSISCSVAVLANPSLRRLKQVHSQLEPGGLCYTEWNRPGPFRHARRLKRAGFALQQSYAVWPPPRRTSPQFWLPLGRSGALDYFLATRPLPRGRVRRCGARATRRLWRLARVLRLLAPIGMITAKEGGPERQRESLASMLLGGWQQWGVGPQPRGVDCLVLTGGRSHLNKIVVLVFADAEQEPRLAVKLARSPDSVDGLRREAAALQAVANTSTHDILDVPRFVFGQELVGTFAIGETIIGGHPIQLELTAGTYREVAGRVTDALRTLVPPAAALPLTDWWSRLVAPVLAEFRARFSSIVDSRRIDDVEAHLRRLPPLPLVPEQRDCSPWNVFVSDGGRLALLDWESAEPRGLPTLDLFYFLAHAAFLADGTLRSGQETRTYRALFDERTTYGRVYSEMVQRYSDGLDLDASALDALRAFMWMVHAIGEFDRALASIADDVADRRRTAARGLLFLALWQQDVKDTTTL